MKTIAMTCMALLAVTGYSAVATADDMPPGLVQAALENYPLTVLCEIERRNPDASPDVPLSEDVARGWLTAQIGTLTPGGQPIAVVLYKRAPIEWGLKLFGLNGNRWDLVAVDGRSSYELVLCGGGDAHNHVDVSFEDLAHDGTKEIVITFRPLGGHLPYPEFHPAEVMVIGERAGALVSMTGVTFTPVHYGRFRGKGGQHCDATDLWIEPDDAFESDTDLGFADIDGDGVQELLLYGVGTQGTRVYKLVNGAYTFQYETPPGISGMPPMGAAMKPASVTLDELQGVRNPTPGANPGEAVALYIMPPYKLTLDDVDWTTLRIGDFTIAATADRGVQPAPYSTGSNPPWIPFGYMGKMVLLEELKTPLQGAFPQDDKDPVIYMAATGRLHMVFPYRDLRFSKKDVFTWLLAQWQKGGGDKSIKDCHPTNLNDQICFTPMHLPIKANLKVVPGQRIFAMGEAVLWVQTREALPSPTPPPTPTPAR